MLRVKPSTSTLEPVDVELVHELERVASGVHARASDRLASAHDASHYLLTPRAVVSPASANEVALILATASRLGVAVTFRSGGTSLSGQASTDGLLVDTRRNFRSIEVLDDGARVRTGPGATVRNVNARLLRWGRKLGPDPASEIACTIGGVVANNSSGMACGVEQNSYRTLESAVLVLPGGTVINTAAPEADEILRASEPVLYAGLERLRNRVRGDEDSVRRIRALYSIKNTMGYGVNSFVDYMRPIDLLLHLAVGSEGTLAFVAEATFHTIPLRTHLATGLLVFADLAAATAAVPALVDAGFATIELMDAASLRVAQRDPEAPQDLRELVVGAHAALLVEFQEATAEHLQVRMREASVLFGTLPVPGDVHLSSDSDRRAALWHLRKGLFALVAGSRPAGTTALLEDIAVPIDRLYDTCRELTDLFERHAYEESVIFGHAKDGNIHFLINERFDDPESLARYEAFTEDMVELVLRQGGTLKAEHGTGRIMAPFVRRQFGDELFDVMCELKRLVDPTGLLNPGVLISDDPRAHLRNLKTAPAVEDEVDRCVECGYCEPVCPSRDLTVTPRERIVLRRELRRAEIAGDTQLAAELGREYQYDGVATCAVDGMCQTACPVLINTGDLVRRLRAESRDSLEQHEWKIAAKHWDGLTRAAGTALTVASKFPAALPVTATDIGRAILGADSVPRYSRELPPGGVRRRQIANPTAEAVYFASCTTTMFGPEQGGGVAESFVSLAAKAGIALVTPPNLPSLCCGTPWKSKGLTDGYDAMKSQVLDALIRATDSGRLPVVCDASSCTEGLAVMLDAVAGHGITVIDAVAFAAERFLPALRGARVIPELTLHPTCSSTRLGINGALHEVATAIAQRVIVPDDWGCCAFAGDRGLLHPELTASATTAESREVVTSRRGAHVSLNRTCELGMTRSTGLGYRHILELLDDAT